MSASAPHNRSDVHIAIVCALRVEADAVLNILDKCWDDEGHEYGRAEHDTNFYTVGSVGQHSVVVVRLSGMGTIRSTDAANNIRHSFPNIQLALVVGVCGAVPTPPGRDIYLGDLIISSRVTQYNCGRQYTNGFQRKSAADGNLPGTSRQVLNFLSFLEQERCNQKIRENIRSSVIEIERRATALSYPGAEHDHLYDPSFIHKHMIRGTCSSCDLNDSVDCELAIKTTCQELGCSSAGRIVRYGRAADSDNQQLKHMPGIHIGHIGTADTVMKSAHHRDQIAENDNIIAFEMEGSGVWDQFPTIVVKGVCDYADSHKNKDWQPYAALIAAIGMKALLNLWTPTVPHRVTEQPRPTPSRAELLSSKLADALHYEGKHTRYDHLGSQKIPPKSFDWVWKTNIRSWLRETSMQSPPFWITGKPGSGKSTLMKYLSECRQTKKLLGKGGKNFSIAAFFFDFRAGTSTANNRLGVMKMLISHLCEINQPVATRLAELNEHDPIESMSEDRLIHCFGTALQDIKTRTYVFVDGLDEFTGEYEDLVYFLEKLQNKTSIRMCLASRPEPVLKRYCMRFPSFAMQDYNATSIQAYIKHAVQLAEDRLMPCEALKDIKLQDGIVRKAQGVIIWARFAIDSLLRMGQGQVSLANLEDALDQLPEDLDLMYERTLKMIPDSVSDEAALLLCWMIAGRTELKVLYGYWHWFFLEYHGVLPSEPALVGDDALASFAIRLAQILGSFVETSTQFKVINYPYDLIYYDPKKRQFRERAGSRLPSAIFKLIAHLHRNRLNYVQITHKTIVDFLRKSDLFQSLVPLELRGSNTLHTAASILVSVTTQGDVDLTTLLPVFRSIGSGYDGDFIATLSNRDCELLLRDLVRNRIWKPRTALVRWCLFNFGRLCGSPSILDPEAFRVALESPLLALGMLGWYERWFRLCIGDLLSDSASIARLSQFASLWIAYCKVMPSFLRDAFEHSTIGSALLPRDRNRLLDLNLGNPPFSTEDIEIANLLAPHCTKILEHLRPYIQGQLECATGDDRLNSAIELEDRSPSTDRNTSAAS
ncbi:hypothetical protein GGR57DRAFT_402881 [Xylariaceae sp. FL1272]|nr:hypothetical protein GGR57DRAFT_402881 [Xylariaceae sp. FL1272]